ncbi:MAG TPA: sigma 54-interacting transcriptional regulator [Vicinamibacterales bacterium]|nr:sigma 54-interacting transcriptional regulator [Vicinamibacterales bacterium]
MSWIPELTGKSTAIRVVEEEAGYAARSDAKVLLTGESGVGKEVIARLVHRESARRSAPFVTINCAGVPDTLLESELFGHERGSFTGAYRDKPGLLESADRGTVFLDEVGEMSVRMQGMLLRFLETGELQRVGASRAQRGVDVRIIAATNRVLMDRIRDGAFREDLYYRLNVIHIAIPPLRDRLDDILPLMEHFLAAFAARAGMPVPLLTAEARAALLQHNWPGNVRELKNMAERLVVRARQEIRAADLNLVVSARPTAAAGGTRPLADSMFERMVRHGESFWIAPYPAFMARDMTRDDLRRIVKLGLEETRGNYKLLVRLFNMDPADYKRFLNFLRKHHCHMPFQAYRTATPDRRELAGGVAG